MPCVSLSSWITPLFLLFWQRGATVTSPPRQYLAENATPAPQGLTGDCTASTPAPCGAGRLSTKLRTHDPPADKDSQSWWMSLEPVACREEEEEEEEEDKDPFDGVLWWWWWCRY